MWRRSAADVRTVIYVWLALLESHVVYVNAYHGARLPALLPSRCTASSTSAISISKTDRSLTRQGLAGLHMSSRVRVQVVGGTGRIGTAVAGHLLSKHVPHGNGECGLHVVLAGRSLEKGSAALAEVEELAGGSQSLAERGHSLEFAPLRQGALRCSLYYLRYHEKRHM